MKIHINNITVISIMVILIYLTVILIKGKLRNLPIRSEFLRIHFSVVTFF